MFDGLLARAAARGSLRLAAAGAPPPSRYVRQLGHEPGARVPGSVLRRRGGGLTAYIELRGLPGYETQSPAERQENRRALNDQVMSLYGPRRAIAVTVSKAKADPSRHPASDMRTALGREVEERYKAELYGDPFPLLDARIFVQLYLRPGPAPRSKFMLSWVGEKRRRRRERLDGKRFPNPRALRRADALREMENFIGQAMDRFREYGPELKGYRGEDGDEDGNLFSGALEAVARILFNEDFRIPVPRGQAARALHKRRVTFAGPVAHVHRPGGDRFATQFTLSGYGAAIKPNAFRPALESPYPSTLTNAFAYWEPNDGRDKMRLKRNQWVTANDPAAGQGRKLLGAAERLMDGEFHLGGHFFNFTAFADDAGGASPEDPMRLSRHRAVADMAEGHLHRVSAAPEDVNPRPAFYAHLVDNEDLQPCPGMCSSVNFASYAPLWLPPRGLARGHWGDPVLVLKTACNTGFPLHLHAPKSLDEAGDLGNALGIGMSGSGKTVLAGRVILGAERHDPDTVVYDRDQGLRILVEYLGGTYLELPVGRPTGMAPLKGLSDTPDHRTFLAAWLLAFRAALGRPRDVDQENRVDQGVEAVMKLPPAQRRLSEVRAFLGHEGDWLDPWCAGPYGDGRGGGALWWAFDGPEDRIMARHRLTGRDITKILDHPAVAGPAMDYMFFSDADRLDGRRKLLMVIDEFWKALLIPAFAARINDCLKTIRKLFGAILLFTQSIKDVLKSPIGHTVLEQCPTRFWFANRKASWEEHEAAGLTPTMWDSIRRSKIAGHPFLVDQQDTSLIATMPTPADVVALVSGTSPRLRLFHRLKKEFGPAPEQWGPHYRRLWPTAQSIH